MDPTVHKRYSLAIATLLCVSANLDCRSRAPDGSRTDARGEVADPRQPYPAPSGAGTLAFPHRPPGCGYEVSSVSPGHPRVSPHAEIYGDSPRVRDLHITFVGDTDNTAVIQWSTDAF